jgi:hypothetical protein
MVLEWQTQTLNRLSQAARCCSESKIFYR